MNAVPFLPLAFKRFAPILVIGGNEAWPHYLQ